MFKTPENFPFWTILITAAIMGIGMYSLWLFKIQPFHGWWNPLYTKLTGIGTTIASTFNIGGILSTLQQTITKDPIKALTVGIPIGLAAITFISKIRADRAKQAMEQAATQQISEINTEFQTKSAELNTSLKENFDLKKQIAELQDSDLSQKLTNAENLISTQKAKLLGDQQTITTLMNKIEEMKINTYEKVIIK